jgi:hypothetical protein
MMLLLLADVHDDDNVASAIATSTATSTATTGYGSRHPTVRSPFRNRLAHPLPERAPRPWYTSCHVCLRGGALSIRGPCQQVSASSLQDQKLGGHLVRLYCLPYLRPRVLSGVLDQNAMRLNALLYGICVIRVYPLATYNSP